MKILVTGGAGYIGSHMIKCLRDAGREVVVGPLIGDPLGHADGLAAELAPGVTRGVVDDGGVGVAQDSPASHEAATPVEVPPGPQGGVKGSDSVGRVPPDHEVGGRGERELLDVTLLGKAQHVLEVLRPVGRPARGERQVDPATDRVRPGLGRQRLDPAFDPLLVPDAVAVREREHLARGVGEPRVPRDVGAGPLLADQCEPRVGGQRTGQVLPGPVVDDDDVEQIARIGLPRDRGEAQREPRGAVAHGDDHRNRRERRHQPFLHSVRRCQLSRHAAAPLDGRPPVERTPAATARSPVPRTSSSPASRPQGRPRLLR